METKEVKNDVKKSLSELMNLGTDLLSNGKGRKGTQLYNENLFSGMLSDEKRRARMKLRKKLESFIRSYIENRKNEKEVEKLRTVWKEYSASAYKNTAMLLQTVGAEQKETIKKFLIEMKDIEG